MRYHSRQAVSHFLRGVVPALLLAGHGVCCNIRSSVDLDREEGS